SEIVDAVFENTKENLIITNGDRRFLAGRYQLSHSTW
ncbi:MAG: hypothetical protein ACI9RZ_001735, partial [Sphingobacteriales bacterium]